MCAKCIATYVPFVAHLHRRGLNPPHRIKSISMTTFSEEEIKHLKEGGNEVRTYMGELTSSFRICYTAPIKSHYFVMVKEWNVNCRYHLHLQ